MGTAVTPISRGASLGKHPPVNCKKLASDCKALAVDLQEKTGTSHRLQTALYARCFCDCTLRAKHATQN
jgi:hypothetical protein